MTDEWTLHHQPVDCRADHEYSFWLGDEIVVMANPMSGHKDKIEFMLKAVSYHDALVNALTELHAQVIGECPSLLNEDSGGDARLSMEINRILDAVSSQKEPL